MTTLNQGNARYDVAAFGEARSMQGRGYISTGRYDLFTAAVATRNAFGAVAFALFEDRAAAEAHAAKVIASPMADILPIEAVVFDVMARAETPEELAAYARAIA